MQLSGLLEKLRGLFSPSFLLSSVTPLFCFFLVNGAILGAFNEDVRNWIKDFFLGDPTKSVATTTIRGGLCALGLLVAAYVFSTLNLGLREVLEGKHIDRGILKKFKTWLETGEKLRLNVLQQQFNDTRATRRGVKSKAEGWTAKLWQNRQAGVNQHKANPTCAYTDKDVPPELAALQDKRWRSELISHTEIELLVEKYSTILSQNSAEVAKDQPGRSDSVRLEHDFKEILDLITYATEKADEELSRVFNEREFNFSRYTIAPTRLGNIAESVNSYAFSRYQMNLDCFWSRMQKIIQGDAAFNGTLQDAKTQVDFAVSSFWLTVLSCCFWLVVLPFVAQTWLPFLAVWILGPIAARFWYFIALQNYRSFADLLRSAVDLYRFKLLDALNIPAPPESEAEQRLWNELNLKIGYGEARYLAYKE